MFATTIIKIIWISIWCLACGENEMGSVLSNGMINIGQMSLMGINCFAQRIFSLPHDNSYTNENECEINDYDVRWKFFGFDDCIAWLINIYISLSIFNIHTHAHFMNRIIYMQINFTIFTLPEKLLYENVVSNYEIICYYSFLFYLPPPLVTLNFAIVRQQ